MATTKELRKKLDRVNARLKRAKHDWHQVVDEINNNAKAWLTSDEQPLGKLAWEADVWGTFLGLRVIGDRFTAADNLFYSKTVSYVYLTADINFNHNNEETYLHVDFDSPTAVEHLRELGILPQNIDLAPLKRKAKHGGRARRYYTRLGVYKC